MRFPTEAGIQASGAAAERSPPSPPALLTSGTSPVTHTTGSGTGSTSSGRPLPQSVPRSSSAADAAASAESNMSSALPAGFERGRCARGRLYTVS